MNIASDRILKMKASQTLRMTQRAAELKSSGVDVVSLSVGEPDFFTPRHIKEAAQKAIAENYSFYAPVAGYLSLREAIANKLEKENDLQYSSSQIIVSTGGKQAICNAILSIINSGDEVIIPAPAWVSYTEMVGLAEGVSVIIKTSKQSGYKVLPQQLEQAITPKTRMFILCSPSNPSGAVYSKSEMRELAKVIAKHPDMMVLSDEIYEHINYVGKHVSMAEFAAIKSQVIIVNGVSKAYAMTGWRIGFLAAEQWVVEACKKLQGQYTTCASTIAMKAAEAAYTGSQDCVKEMLEQFRRRRDLVTEMAQEIRGFEVEKPDGAFYLFPKIDSLFGAEYIDKNGEKQIIGDSEALAEYILEEAHVASVAGSAFLMPECIRFSYATSEENLKKAFSRIKIAVEKLRYGNY